MSKRPLPGLPEPMTLSALQAYVRAVVEARNFTRERDKLLILLVEEVGELAAEYRHRAHDPCRFDPTNLSYEIIDIFLYLLDLANGYGVALVEVWPAAEYLPAEGGEGARGEPTLNELARRAAEEPPASTARKGGNTDELQALRLCEAVGELARDVRKSWKGLENSGEAALRIVDALKQLLAIGASLEMDFETALTAKEKQNAARSWTY